MSSPAVHRVSVLNDSVPFRMPIGQEFSVRRVVSAVPGSGVVEFRLSQPEKINIRGDGVNTYEIAEFFFHYGIALARFGLAVHAAGRIALEE